LVSTFGSFYQLRDKLIAGTFDKKSPMYDIISSAIATTMGLVAASTYGLYVESRLALVDTY
jgi:hypothetical protein